VVTDPTSGRAAVLDVGCFSAHLLVVESDLSRQVASHKVRLRLDLEIGPDGCISSRGIDDIVAAVRTTHRRLRGLRTTTFLPFATSSVRDAANAGAVVDTVERETGVTLRFLSPEQEARLAYQAARRWYGSTGPLTVLDVGGGTIEIAYGHDDDPVFACSLPLGARTLTRAGLASPARLELARTRLAKEIRDALPRALRRDLAQAPAIGCSRVFQSLAKLAGSHRLCTEDLAAWTTRLVALPPRRRAELPGISAHRATQIAGGAVVAEALMRTTGHDKIDICPWSTREGVLLTLLQNDVRQ
jgi:exopolyphosphatase/guanosine-5'-triphosphate,3'-diphosphate pyrophosphatase